MSFWFNTDGGLPFNMEQHNFSFDQNQNVFHFDAVRAGLAQPCLREFISLSDSSENTDHKEKIQE